MRHVLIILPLLCALLLLGNCASEPQDKTNNEAAALDIPDQIISDSETWLTRGNRRTGVIRAETLVVYSAKDTTLLYDVAVDFFDTNGVLTSSLTADSGRVTRRSTQFSVFGDVQGQSNSGKKLLTDSLRWNSQSDKVETEGFVKFIRGIDDTLSGFGLEADAKLEDVRIKKDIRGSFREPKAKDD
ncbi:MAG: LPS export ABC transporter periplasmic protein LptC [bacterium]